MTSTHEHLFQKLNRQYFNGSLPEYHIVLTDDLHGGVHGHCQKGKREIHLDKSLQGEQLIETLLHEMAHAAVQRRGHGKQWLERVSKIGSASHQVLMCDIGYGLSFCHQEAAEAVE